MAECCINKLQSVVNDCIVPDITEKTLNRISKRIGTTAAGLPIDVHLGSIYEKVYTGDENTIDIFVPYGLPSVGSLYTTAAFLNGPAITDKTKEDMDGPQRGFYVAVKINYNDFNGIRLEEHSEAIKVSKNMWRIYAEAVREDFEKVWSHCGLRRAMITRSM